MQPEPIPTGLQLFRPPYRDWEPIPTDWSPPPVDPGAAAVWFIVPTRTVYDELDWVAERPRSLPFFVVLPEPEDVLPLAGLLRRVPGMSPRGVLPSAGAGTMGALRTLLAAPPRSLPRSVTDYLGAAGLGNDGSTRRRIETIFAAAPHVTSIDGLAARMCQSRRTLGRYFHERGLPVPSHWLQFARMLHVALHLQNSRTNINRVSSRFGFPDGFTMSNGMKRLTGYRPSFVREHLGWEWIVETWWRKEGLG